MSKAIKNIYVIVCPWDEEARVWYIQESDVPGLSIEAPTREAMTNRIVQAIPELLRLNNTVHVRNTWTTKKMPN